MPYYLRFVDTFPTVASLAKAPEQKVLRLWQGLGYYSRARNLHRCAKTVVEQHAGKFPDTYTSLLQLPGIGPYTAAAIASIAFGERVAVVDGNVFRVLSRLFGIDADIASPAGRKIFTEKANQLVPSGDPGRFNQALMEFGALHCTPRNPLCHVCPLEKVCVARRTGQVQLLPVKIRKLKIRVRHFHYFVLLAGKKIALKERTLRDIWSGLHDFALIETTKPLTRQQLEALPASAGLPKRTNVKHVSSKVHLLTHQRLNIHFYRAEISEENLTKLNESFGRLQWYSPKQAGTLPKPVVVTRFLEEHKLIRATGKEKV